MGDFYYGNTQGNGNWDDPLNWFTEPSLSNPAPGVPGSGDTAYIAGDLGTGTGGPTYSTNVSSGSVGIALTASSLILVQPNGSTYGPLTCGYGTITIQGSHNSSTSADIVNLEA